MLEYVRCTSASFRLWLRQTMTQYHQHPPLDARLDIQSYEAKDEDLEQGHLLGRSARSRLRNWLRMFSNTNPKAFYRSQDLRGAFYDLLADPDSDLRACHSSLHLHTLRSPRRLPGRSCSSHNKSLKKPAILSAFKGCVTEESDLLVELMLRRLTSSRSNSQNNLASIVKRQLGFLSLLGDVLKTLGRQLVHRWDDFLNQIMQFVLDSQSHIQTLINNANSQHVFLESQLKKVRVQTLHRLNDFFMLKLLRLSSRYSILDLVGKNRCQSIVNVNLQSSRWCFRSLKTYHNIELHPAEVIAEQYLKPYFGTLLPDLAELLRKASSASSLTTCISRQQIVLMSSLAITDTTHSERFCELILTLQLKNQVIVAEHIQAGLLHLLAGFLSTALRVASSLCASTCYQSYLDLVSKRLQDLNSFSTKRIDEPDFEKRLNAFSQLENTDSGRGSTLTPKEWESAAAALCHFLALAEQAGQDVPNEPILDPRRVLFAFRPRCIKDPDST
ncbi:hypothetical protein H4Q26_008303 [Puccinia striiformis f. sp. tritici PST-130]|nr:hypothetical protein H4Q26_008303 [Puccinia striiformis f. sp. tritici PST-130]